MSVALTNTQRREQYSLEVATLHTQLKEGQNKQNEHASKTAHLQVQLGEATAQNEHIENTQKQNGDKLGLLHEGVTASDSQATHNLNGLDSQRVKLKKSKEELEGLDQTESCGYAALKCLRSYCKGGSQACKIACTVTVISLVGAGGGAATAYVESEDLTIGSICGGLIGFAVTSVGFCAYYYGKKCIAKSQACLREYIK